MATLSIVFQGEDGVSDVTHKVTLEIAQVGDAAEKAAPKGKGFFGGMLEAASGFLMANVVGKVADQVGQFVSEGFSAARDTQQLMAQTQTIIENTGGAAGMSAQQVADLASSLSDAAGQSLFGDDQIQGAENVLLKYKELKGIIPGVTQLSVDMAQSLGKDPAAAAEFLGRALQKPFDAANKLAKEGIVLTDSQKATLAAFKATGDVAGAQAFLMEQLNGTYAGSAKAAADAAGGSVQFKARMGEAAETVATALLPVVDKLTGLLVTYLAPAIEMVATWLGDNLPGAIDVVTTAIDAMIGWLTKAGTESDDLATAVQALATYWTETLQPALVQVWQFIQDNIIPIIETLVNAAFAILKEDIRILAALWVNVLWPALQKVWQFIQANILPILATLIVWIRDNLPPTIRALALLWTQTLLPAITAVWQFIDTKVLPILKAIGDVITATVVVAFKLIVGTLTTTVIPIFEKLWGFLDKNVIPILKQIGEVILNAAGPAIAYLGEKIAPVVDFFAQLLDNVSGVVGWLETLADKIRSIKIPSWAGGGGGGAPPSESSGSTEVPPGTGGPITGQSLGRLGGLGRPSAPTGGGQTTVRIVFDAGALQKLIRATVEETLAVSGQRSLSRMRTGN